MDYQNQRCYLANFVDDLLLIGPTEFKNFILKKLSDHNLDVKHLMPTTESVDDKTILKRKIVGVELEELYEDNIRKSLKVHQKTYLEKIVKKFLKINDSTKATPPPYYIDASYTEGADHEQRVKKAQEIIGSLLYLGCHTRPDVIFHIHYISQFQKQPSDQVFYFLDRLLRYLNGTKEYGLNYYHSTATEIDEIHYGNVSHPLVIMKQRVDAQDMLYIRCINCGTCDLEFERTKRFILENLLPLDGIKVLTTTQDIPLIILSAWFFKELQIC